MRRAWIVRAAAVVLGACAMVMLLRSTGVETVAEHLERAASAIVLICVLELFRLGAELGATAAQLGRYAKPLGFRALVRGHLLSYATTTLAPAGRVAGEAIKAAAFTPMLGAPFASAMAVRIRALGLFAGGGTTLVCVPVVHAFDAPRWLIIGLAVLAIAAAMHIAQLSMACLCSLAAIVMPRGGAHSAPGRARLVHSCPHTVTG